MSTTDLPALVPDVVAIARRASQEILRIYNRGFDVRDKADASPITEADEASEALILAGLKSLTPDIPAFGEETVSRGEANADSLPPRFWLVDPLDGTREFVSRKLLGRKLTKGLVRVQAPHDIIAKTPGCHVVPVVLKPLGLGEANHIEPVLSPFLAVVGTRQNAINQFWPGVR